MAGYSEMATVMAENPESVVFRNFQALHARIILFLQADIVCAEEELDEIVEEAKREAAVDNDKLEMPPEEGLNVCWDTTRDRRTRLAREHWDKIKEIEAKLENYYTNMLRWREIQKLGTAAPADLQWVKDWVLFHNSLGARDKRPWLLTKPSEMSALSPELDGVDAWLARNLTPIWHRLIGERWKDRCRRRPQQRQGQDARSDLEAGAPPNCTVYRYGPGPFVVLGNICTVLISSAVLVCSTVVLNFTTNTDLRLVFISVFTLVFASILMFVAHCRRFEVFAGTAAFCAVLIVFIQGVQCSGGSQIRSPNN